MKGFKGGCMEEVVHTSPSSLLHLLGSSLPPLWKPWAPWAAFGRAPCWAALTPVLGLCACLPSWRGCELSAHRCRVSAEGTLQPDAPVFVMFSSDLRAWLGLLCLCGCVEGPLCCLDHLDLLGNREPHLVPGGLCRVSV